MKFSEVATLLKFMYQGEVSVKHEELSTLLKLAEVLKVKGLTLDQSVIDVRIFTMIYNITKVISYPL